MKFVHGITVTVLPRSPGRDQYGDTIDPEGSGHRIRWCAVAPRMDGDTIARGRNGTVVGVTVVVPPGADLRGDDTVTLDHPDWPGRWIVDGDVVWWRSPLNGINRGATVDLVRAAG